MSRPDIAQLLNGVLDLLSRSENPSSIDIEHSLLNSGCMPARAELLADYLPAACGRAFLRELGVNPSDTYSRRNCDGSWGPPTAFADDPLWKEVEDLVETIRTDLERRNQFAIAAGLSAEVSAINEAVNAGKSISDLAGGEVGTVFLTPLKHKM